MRSFGCSIQSDGQGEDHSEHIGPDGQCLLYVVWGLGVLECGIKGSQGATLCHPAG